MSVIENPQVTIEYTDPDVQTVFNQVIAKEIVAYDNHLSASQTLTLGATSNVNIEAVNDVNIYTKGTGDFNLFASSFSAETSQRSDVKIMTISDSGDSTTVVSAPFNRSITLAPSDARNTVTAGSLSIYDESNYTYIDSAQTLGVRFDEALSVNGHLRVTSNATVSGTMAVGDTLLSYGGVFGKNINVWKDMNSNNPIDRIGYALNINDKDQLEIIKMYRYNDSEGDTTKTTRTRRVAVFDNKTTDSNIQGDSSYLEFNSLNGVDVVDSQGNIIQSDFWQATTENTIYYDVAGEDVQVVIGANRAPTRSNVRFEVVGGDVMVHGDILPSIYESNEAQEIGYNLGSPELRWKDLYLSGNTIYMGSNVAIKVDETRNTVKITYSNEESNIELFSTEEMTATSNYVFHTLTARVDTNSNVAYSALPKSGGTVTGDVIIHANATACNVTTSNIQYDSTFIRLTSSNVGIDFTEPAYKLHVNGDIASGNDVISNASDARLKQNIRTIADPLHKLSQIRGVYYDWKPEVTTLGFVPLEMNNQMGCIAQEVRAVIPEICHPAPFDTIYDPLTKQRKSKSGQNYLTLQYEKLVPLLIESTKSLYSRVVSLEQIVYSATLG